MPRRVIRRPNPCQILRPALLHHRQPCPQLRGQRRDRHRHNIAEHASAERTTQHQQAQRSLRGHIGQGGQRRDRRTHRIAGDHGCRACRHPLRRSETQRQHIGMPRQEPVGAPQHRILLVQDHRWAMPHQSRRQHRRHAGISTEPHHRGRIVPRQDPPRLHHTACQRQHRGTATQRTAPRDPRAADDEALQPGEHGTLQSARPRIGHQRHAPPALQQFAGQCLGGEEVATGSACRDHNGKHRRTPHGTSP